MARLIKDGTLRGQRVATEFPNKAPSKTLIIPGQELVQVIAKVQKNVLHEQGADDTGKVPIEKQMHTDGAQLSKSEALQSSQGGNIDGWDEVGSTVNATVQVPPHGLLMRNENTTSAGGESSERPVPGKIPRQTQSVNSNVCAGSSKSSSSERVDVAPVSTRYGLSPSSSVGSLSSEKSIV